MDDAELHSAGAIVRHNSPFEQLPVYTNNQELTAEFLQKWVIPYYMDIGSYVDDQWVEKIRLLKSEITRDTCILLLGDFNWRTRLAGAYFAAVKGYTSLIPVIGTHLLQSKVCYVGHIYALVLAFFNTKESGQYLHDYLGYYLTQPRLYFDQQYVLEAAMYLEEQNGIHTIEKYLSLWNLFLAERKKMESIQRTQLIAQLGESEIANQLKNKSPQQAADTEENTIRLSTDYYDKQVQILKQLAEKD